MSALTSTRMAFMTLIFKYMDMLHGTGYRLQTVACIPNMCPIAIVARYLHISNEELDPTIMMYNFTGTIDKGLDRLDPTITDSLKSKRQFEQTFRNYLGILFSAWQRF